MRSRHITFNSPVILTFVLISFAAMAANYLTAGMSNKLLFMTYHSPLTSPMTYVRFFTHVLGHAGWSHYIGNMMYLLLLGPMLEEKYGSKAIKVTEYRTVKVDDKTYRRLVKEPDKTTRSLINEHTCIKRQPEAKGKYIADD